MSKTSIRDGKADFQGGGVSLGWRLPMKWDEAGTLEELVCPHKCLQLPLEMLLQARTLGEQLGGVAKAKEVFQADLSRATPGIKECRGDFSC